MKIDSIKINGFGKLKEQEIELKDGMNIIYGENEAGKSTILKCMQAMLFGLSKLKNGKNRSDFDQYNPWDDTVFSGKMKYTLDNGEEYEIFRDFKKKNPVIYNSFQEDISKTFKADKSKGISFFEEQVGVDEATFANTAIIGQQEVKLGKAETNSIVQKISNLVSTGDDNISYKKSMDKLTKMQNERVGTSKTRQKPINITEENIQKLLREKKSLSSYKESLSSHAKEKEKLNDKLQTLLKKKMDLKEKQKNQTVGNTEKEGKKINRYTYLLILFVIIWIVLLVAVKNIIMSVVLVVPIVVVAFLMRRKSKSEWESWNNKREELARKCELEQENLQNEINQTNVRMQILDAEKNDIDEKLERLAKIEEELEEQELVKADLESLAISFEIAKDALTKAYDEIKHNLSPKFEQNLCKVTSEMTSGKYSQVKVDDESGILVEVENGEYMPVDRLSIGTIDEMYLALRISTLSEVAKENLPIILDETFAYFDNERLKNILCYLQDQNYNNQIIIFTCSNREADLLKQLKIEYHQITLEN